MRLKATLTILLVISVCAGVASAAQTVRVTAAEGRITYQTLADSSVRSVQAGTVLAEGDVVRLAEGARLSLRFVDGATMDVSGPASFRLKLLSVGARTIQLYYGTIDQLTAKGTVTGVMTVCNTVCALKNGSVYIRGEAGDRIHRAIFKLFSGTDARVGQDGETMALTTDKPAVFEADGVVPRYDWPGALKRVVNEGTSLKIGDKIIKLSPAGAFEIKRLEYGKVLITANVPVGAFGVITLEDYTTFYLGAGESIIFSASGEVDRHIGIQHIYGPLDRRGLYDEPIEGPADSSFTGTRVDDDD